MRGLKAKKLRKAAKLINHQFEATERQVYQLLKKKYKTDPENRRLFNQ